jgi:hypothetical protein
LQEEKGNNFRNEQKSLRHIDNDNSENDRDSDNYQDDDNDDTLVVSRQLLDLQAGGDVDMACR